jgi:soluble lytic murein transglycosylase-like protein
MSRFATTLVPEDPAGERTIPPSKAPTGMARKTQYDRDVLEAASLYGLDSALIHAVIHVESRYSADAISHKGATGLMQLMPATAKRYGVANSLDPVQNIRGGAQYLRDLLNMFNGDVDLALAAYNAGENAVLRHGKRIPPFSETADYVRMVKTIYKKYTSGSLE